MALLFEIKRRLCLPALTGVAALVLIACPGSSSTSVLKARNANPSGASNNATPGGSSPVGATGPGGSTSPTGPSNATGPATCVPNGAEVPYDGVDNDCDAETKDDDLDGDGFVQAQDCDEKNNNVHVAIIGYVDNDGDSESTPVNSSFCAEVLPAGYVAEVGDDCDDGNPFKAHHLPDLADDGIDNDCDGFDVKVSEASYGFVNSGVACEDSTNGGTLALPFCSLQYAVSNAEAPSVGPLHLFVSSSGTRLANEMLDIKREMIVHGGYDGAWNLSLQTDKYDIGDGFSVPPLMTTHHTRVQIKNETTARMKVALRGLRITAGSDLTATTPAPLFSAVGIEGPVDWTLADCEVSTGGATAWDTVLSSSESRGALIRTSVAGGASNQTGHYTAVRSGGSLLVWNSTIDDTVSGNTEGDRTAVLAFGPLYMSASKINFGNKMMDTESNNTSATRGVWVQAKLTAQEVVLLNNTILAGFGKSVARAVQLQAAGGTLANNILGCGSLAADSEGVQQLQDSAGTLGELNVLNNAFAGECATNASGRALHVSSDANFNLLRLTVTGINTCAGEGCPVLHESNQSMIDLPASSFLSSSDACYEAGTSVGMFQSYGLALYDQDGTARPMGLMDCGPDEIP